MRYFSHTGALLLKVSGRDSRRYLNARLTNDIKILAPGSECYAAALSPQGRCEGFFHVICRAEEEFLLSCDGGEKDGIIAALKRYIVADRVTVEDCSSDLRLFSLFPGDKPQIAALGLNTLPKEGTVQAGELLISPSRRSRKQCYDALVPASQAEELKAELKKAGAAELDFQSFAALHAEACLPIYPEVLNDERLFSAYGLDFSVSFKKGCYVGQEVVEKIDAYAKLPYLVKVLESEGEMRDLKVAIGADSLPSEKVIRHFYSAGSDKSYIYIELKNRDDILTGSFQVNSRPAKLIC